MSTRGVKGTLYAAFAAVAKELAHEHRLELLERVAQGEASVETLAAGCGLSVANTSQHLQLLRRAGLVGARSSRFVLYRLTDSTVLAAISAIQRVAKQNVAEVGRIVRSYFTARDDLEPV